METCAAETAETIQPKNAPRSSKLSAWSLPFPTQVIRRQTCAAETIQPKNAPTRSSKLPPRSLPFPTQVNHVSPNPKGGAYSAGRVVRHPSATAAALINRPVFLNSSGSSQYSPKLLLRVDPPTRHLVDPITLRVFFPDHPFLPDHPAIMVTLPQRIHPCAICIQEQIAIAIAIELELEPLGMKSFRNILL
jgi:hypothetical protein